MCELRPAFESKSSKMLKDRICKGLYKKVSQMYSEDLRQIVSLMLQVS